MASLVDNKVAQIKGKKEKRARGETAKTKNLGYFYPFTLSPFPPFPTAY